MRNGGVVLPVNDLTSGLKICSIEYVAGMNLAGFRPAALSSHPG